MKQKKSFKAWGAIALSVLLLFAVCLFGCAPNGDPPDSARYTKMGDDGTWGIYLYMCGSNLETKFGAAGKNLDEILSEDIPNNVNFIVETGGASKWRSHDIDPSVLTRFKAQKGNLATLSTLPLDNMGSQTTFEDFLTFCVRNYPAANMCVILWDHGGGSLEGVANDENFGYDALTLDEINKAFASVKKIMTDKFEMVGFDACLMSNYETIDMLSPYARYVVGSEEIEPSGGWNYNALIGGLTKEGNGETLGKEICDGYFQKCADDNKQSTATLAVTDTEKFKSVKSAFEDMTAGMFRSVEEAAGIHAVAQGANEAQKFGGNSDGEGYSNLVDMKDFADNAVDVGGSSQLSAAIGEAVIYNVYGKSKSRSGGVSFFYPLHFDGAQYEKYYNGICPSDNYKKYLNAVYGSIPDDPIKFIDCGSKADDGDKADDGSFRIKLSESSRNYILSVDFDLLEITYSDDGQSDGQGASNFTLCHLGRDNDRLSDQAELTYTSNFRGIWLTLNGCKLYVTPVEDTEEHIIFTAPIRLNGAVTNLKFEFIWDDGYSGGGYYKILGAWEGIDEFTGMSNKEIKSISPDDRIEVIYPSCQYTMQPDGTVKGSKEEMLEELVPKGEDGYKISEEPLGESGAPKENRAYIYQFVVTDIFGNEHYSDAAVFFMNYSYDELKANPMPDGESAGYIYGIYGMSDKSIL